MKAMQNSANSVTVNAIAASLNLSRKTVSRALNGHSDVAAQTAALVKEKAEEMGYDAVAIRGRARRKFMDFPSGEVSVTSQKLASSMHFPAGMTKHPNYMDVARECGMSKGAVRNILSPNGKSGSHYAPETIANVFAAAERIGWASPGTPRYIEITKKIEEARNYLHKSNFRCKEDEKRRMFALRQQGYTNARIAKKVGCSHHKVIDWIGVQPDEYTHESAILAGKMRTEQRKARERLVLSQKISAFQSAQKEYDAGVLQAKQMEAESARIMAEAQRIADEAKKKRIQLEEKVIELSAFRKEAELAAKALGRSLA